jgi:D-ribose pyranose/furanose isomerase RbsD
MKKIILLLLVASTTFCIGQKKKSKANPITVLAKFENISIETNKTDLNLIIVAPDGKKEAVLIKNTAPGLAFKDCKIIKFTSGGKTLHNLSWMEKVTIGDPKIKIEESIKTINEVWDITLKAKVFTNEQAITNIKEQVFLDKLKNASETQERTRREGQEFSLQPDGVVILKSKNMESRLAYSTKDSKFMPLLKKKK